MQALIPLLLQAAVQYGPEFVQAIIQLLKKQDVTVADIEAAFGNLKPYDAYNIPDTTPTTPTITTN